MKWKIVFDHDIEKEREESRRMQEFYDGYDFDTPAEYLKRAWEDSIKDNVYLSVPDIDVPIGERYELSPSLCEREKGKKFAEDIQEGCMGPHEHTDIWRITWDGQEIFNSHKKFEIREAIFHNPATVVYWADDSKTVVTCMDNVIDGKPMPAETYSKETGLALCYMKKALGNKGNYNNVFRQWITED